MTIPSLKKKKTIVILKNCLNVLRIGGIFEKGEKSID